MFRVDYFWFGLVFIKKKVTNPILKKSKPVQTDRFRFGFLGQKPAQTGLAWFFRFWLGFFPVWLGFFLGLGSVWIF
jgi:hypothetical protein